MPGRTPFLRQACNLEIVDADFVEMGYRNMDHGHSPVWARHPAVLEELLDDEQQIDSLCLRMWTGSCRQLERQSSGPGGRLAHRASILKDP